MQRRVGSGCGLLQGKQRKPTRLSRRTASSICGTGRIGQTGVGGGQLGARGLWQGAGRIRPFLDLVCLRFLCQGRRGGTAVHWRALGRCLLCCPERRAGQHHSASGLWVGSCRRHGGRCRGWRLQQAAGRRNLGVLRQGLRCGVRHWPARLC